MAESTVIAVVIGAASGAATAVVVLYRTFATKDAVSERFKTLTDRMDTHEENQAKHEDRLMDMVLRIMSNKKDGR